MKLLKKRGALLLLVVLILISTMPAVWADTTPQVSDWAIPVLNEGEKYGMYPQEWYLSDFQQPISEDRMDTLLKGVERKLSKLAEPEDFPRALTLGTRTRGDVLLSLYNLMGRYGLLSEKPQGLTPIAYLQSLGIVSGDGTDLAISKPCTTEEAVLLATKTVYSAYAGAERGGKGVLWKVTHNGNTVYLLGSIHVGSTELYPIHPALRKAYESSDVLAVEANVLNVKEGMEYYFKKVTYPEGDSIKNHVSAATYAKLERTLKKMGVDAEPMLKIKPWGLASGLSNIAAAKDAVDNPSQSTVATGIDMYFLVNALMGQKETVELESVPFQTDLLDSLSPQFQEEYLNAALDEILSESPASVKENLIQEWLLAWEKGDVKSFTESFNAQSAQEQNELSDKLFGVRDTEMAKKIIDMLEGTEPKTYFVVVGAGHLLHKDTNIVEYLKKEGFTVTFFY